MRIKTVKELPKTVMQHQGRPRDYRKTKYYPAIRMALRGKIGCVDLGDEPTGILKAPSLANNLRHIIKRNGLAEKIRVAVSCDKVFIYPHDGTTANRVPAE